MNFLLKRKNQSAVNQPIVQFQELHDKANSLSDCRDFYDPETASSSGLSHVPSNPLSIPSLCGLISRDSCMQPDTRNSFGMPRNVFEDLPAPSEPPAAFLGNSRSMTSAPCDPMCPNTRRPAERANELERNPQNFAIPTPRSTRKLPTWIPPLLCRRSLSSELDG